RRRSADQAIVDELPTVNARARASTQNNWVGASITEGYRRHVVGARGIICRSDARDEKGEPITEFNRAADRLFLEQWARHPRRCDIERRKTFSEMQGLMVEELVDVGQSLLIWSYQRERDHVGLKLQLIEPEQLATDLYLAPGTNN